MTLVIF
ncbi:hypothetical protein Zm00014a_004769 [Zea mays]|nr:hypothetical protein Zm00014a_004769 [Zea mays]